MEYKITEAKKKDVLGILTVQKEAWLATYPNTKYGITVQDVLSKDFTNAKRVLEWAETIVSSISKKIFVAKYEEEIVGFVLVENGDTANSLTAIYILPKFQRMGIGSELFKSALVWLGDGKDIVVEVVSYNQQAISFYKKLGFKITTRKIPDYLLAGKIIPMVELILAKTCIL